MKVWMLMLMLMLMIMGSTGCRVALGRVVIVRCVTRRRWMFVR